jgi:hypothetical protein
MVSYELRLNWHGLILDCHGSNNNIYDHQDQRKKIMNKPVKKEVKPTKMKSLVKMVEKPSEVTILQMTSNLMVAQDGSHGISIYGLGSDGLVYGWYAKEKIWVE